MNPQPHAKKHRLVQRTSTRSSKASISTHKKNGWPGEHWGGCSTIHRVDQPHLGVQSTITDLNFQPTSGGNLEHWGAKATCPMVDRHGKVPFGLPHIRLVFSAGTVFFSHNNSARTVFFSQFQPRFIPANGECSTIS